MGPRRVNAWLKAFGEFLQEADARFRALAAEVRALAVPGPAGAKGDVGEKGADGLLGPIGPPGPAGEKGIPGATGDRGEKGEDGIGVIGPIGLPGTPGTDGPPGRDGRDAIGTPGKDGTNGKDGRDGITPEQLKEVIAQAKADGAAELLAGIEFDGRTWKIGDRTVRTAAPEYREVYREGEQYERGDFATFGGSVWYCRQTTTTKPGEGNPAWLLAVKHGRDGRDGKDGAPAHPRPVVRSGSVP